MNEKLNISRFCQAPQNETEVKRMFEYRSLIVEAFMAVKIGIHIFFKLTAKLLEYSISKKFGTSWNERLRYIPSVS